MAFPSLGSLRAKGGGGEERGRGLARAHAGRLAAERHLGGRLRLAGWSAWHGSDQALRAHHPLHVCLPQHGPSAVVHRDSRQGLGGPRAQKVRNMPPARRCCLRLGAHRPGGRRALGRTYRTGSVGANVGLLDESTEHSQRGVRSVSVVTIISVMFIIIWDAPGGGQEPKVCVVFTAPSLPARVTPGKHNESVH